jgi:hypothetical protein
MHLYIEVQVVVEEEETEIAEVIETPRIQGVATTRYSNRIITIFHILFHY